MRQFTNENGTVVKELSRYLGRETNNVAEYEGLLIGLEAFSSWDKKTYRAERFAAYGAATELRVPGQGRKTKNSF